MKKRSRSGKNHDVEKAFEDVVAVGPLQSVEKSRELRNTEAL
jgi:hypothetical protein